MKQKRLRVDKAIKAIARERIGSPKASRAIEPKESRKRPKHKKSDLPEPEAAET